LRQFAGLEKQVMLVGQGSHFELWSQSGWQAQLEMAMAQGDDVLPPDLAGFSL
jgi:MraZ protein